MKVISKLEILHNNIIKSDVYANTFVRNLTEDR